MEPKPKPRKARGKRAELERWIERNRPAEIGRLEWEALRRELAPVSPGYLRKLLRESGAKLAPVVEGVRQENFAVLEWSLMLLLEDYERCAVPDCRQEIRRLVIEAKDHARLAGRKPEKTAEKAEMALWMLTWLENPPLFPQWVQLRRQALPELSSNLVQ
jgi:hypothetical protein